MDSLDIKRLRALEARVCDICFPSLQEELHDRIEAAIRSEEQNSLREYNQSMLAYENLCRQTQDWLKGDGEVLYTSSYRVDNRTRWRRNVVRLREGVVALQQRSETTKDGVVLYGIMSTTADPCEFVGEEQKFLPQEQAPNSYQELTPQEEADHQRALAAGAAAVARQQKAEAEGFAAGAKARYEHEALQWTIRSSGHGR